MKISLEPVNAGEKEILRNLLEKYFYEFSQWDGQDINELGLYGYDYLDHYWTEENRWAFFIRVDRKLAGFVMVNDYPEIRRDTDYSLAEFFILYKYRRRGIGTYAVFEIFRRLRGSWQLKVHPKNTASAAFWNRVINDYTDGCFERIPSCPGVAYEDGTLADVYLFCT